jgi:hypothetical protein
MMMIRRIKVCPGPRALRVDYSLFCSLMLHKRLKQFVRHIAHSESARKRCRRGGGALAAVTVEKKPIVITVTV